MTKWYGNLRLSELNENPESGWIYYNVWGDGSYSEEMEQPPFTLKIENGEVTNIYSNYHPPKFKQLDRLVEKTDDILISYFKKRISLSVHTSLHPRSTKPASRKESQLPSTRVGY